MPSHVAANPGRIVIGLMSGTSADGIDAVACRVHGRGERMRTTLLHHAHRRYSQSLRADLLATMAPARTRTEQLCRLDWAVVEAFAEAADRLMRRAGLPATRVTAIGMHGQTVCHLPDRRVGRPRSRDRGGGRPRSLGATLQLGRAALVAARTGCTVVSDFRSADMAVLGQGAPLVPWTDWLLLRHDRLHRAVQNIGGIANVTYLPAGGRPGEVVAFDTGPGNMVIDELVSVFTSGRSRVDPDGRFARSGRVQPELLRAWLRHHYFHRRPPKSCGREDFGRSFVAAAQRQFARRRWPAADWLRTAAELTVESIARAYESFLRRARGTGAPPGILPAIDEVIVCGGGAKNRLLLRLLSDRLAPARVRTIEDLGIPVAAKEALSFALLACACLDGVPANLPQVTRANRRVVLGQVCRTEGR